MTRIRRAFADLFRDKEFQSRMLHLAVPMALASILSSSLQIVDTLMIAMLGDIAVAAVGIALSACFQALGNGIYSTIVSICRQMLVLLPVAYLLSLTGEVNAVWLAFPIAEVISAATTLLLFRRIYRAKIKPLFQ